MPVCMAGGVAMADSPADGPVPFRDNDQDKPEPHFSLLYLLYFAAMHGGALLALAYFSWTNLAVMLGLYVLTGLGITVGYHRLLAHRSFRVPRLLERIIATCGALAMQGGPIMWVTDHRQHHFHSDAEGDPHDIGRGMFFAHMGWLLYVFPHDHDQERMSHLARDLLRDPYLRWLQRYHYLPGFALGALLLWVGGLGLFLWGFCARVVLLYHSTWLVNSAAHAWGYRTFEGIPGTNSWPVALLAFGEGWHNNHHAWPSSARHGLRPWELDLSWLLIAGLRRLGLASSIRVFRFDGPEGAVGRMTSLD